MAKRIVFFLIALLTAALPAGAAAKKFTLVVDAGHGGHDAGACGAISKEKNLTLKFALAFGQMVERNCPDVKVVYTRKTDRFVELWERAEIANKNKADLFISVHINALPRGHIARGFQTYTLGPGRKSGLGVIKNLEVAKRENSVILLEKNYKQTYQGYDPNSPESNIIFEFIQDKNMELSVDLARFMQRHVCEATGRQNMGAHQDNLAVLRLSSMPSALLELGFISTPDEERFMNSAEATERYARGIYNAFMAYRRKHDPNFATPIKPDKEEGIRVPQIVPQKQEPVKEAEPKKPAPAEQPKVQEAPEITVPQEAPEKPDTAEAPVQPATSAPEGAAAVPVFKVQFLASGKKLASNSPRFNGLKDVTFYQEGGLYKYTTGASDDYNAISRLRREVAEKFPQAFIIAFKNGEKMNVNAAIQEFKNNKNKK